MEKYVSLNPRLIRCDVSLNKGSTTTLHLRNISDQPLAYKVTANLFRRHHINPSVVVLQPQETIQFQFTQKPLDQLPLGLNNYPDEFLLNIVSFETLPANMRSDYVALLDMWRTIPQDRVLRTRIDVSLNPTNLLTESSTKSITVRHPVENYLSLSFWDVNFDVAIGKENLSKFRVKNISSQPVNFSLKTKNNYRYMFVWLTTQECILTFFCLKRQRRCISEDDHSKKSHTILRTFKNISTSK